MSESKEALFDIVFRGDILPGQMLPDVKVRLGQLFKIDDTRVNALFTGGAVPLKRNVNRATAEKYQAAIARAGAETQLMEAGRLAAKVTPKRSPTASSVSPRPVKKTPAEPVAKLSLAERLEAQEKERLEKEAQVAREAKQKADAEYGGLSLAPVGADVLKPEERSHVDPVSVDVSRLSLREGQGNLLDDSEQPVTPDVEVDVSDISLDELGSDLLLDNEKRVIPELALDLSALELAEAGVDLGQMKKPQAPEPPDVSSIHLQE